MTRYSGTQTALNLLARREHSAKELINKLSQRGFTRAESEEALRYCQERGLQSDERFAAMLCRTRIAQGYGPLKIEQALIHAGIKAFKMDEVLQEESTSWQQQASWVLEKHAWRFNNKPEENHRRRRFLMSRGYPFEIIQEVLREKNDYENS